MAFGAIREIARVLKPGGRALISDVRHHGEYADSFRANGFTDVRRIGSPAGQWAWSVLTWGTFRPATLLARIARGTRRGRLSTARNSLGSRRGVSLGALYRS